MNISEIIGSVAPALGAALGGPAGGAVGLLVSKILGVDTNDEQAVIEAVKDPAAIIKLKELELELSKVSANVTEIEASDAKDARHLTPTLIDYCAILIIVLYFVMYLASGFTIIFGFGTHDYTMFGSLDFTSGMIIGAVLNRLFGYVSNRNQNNIHNIK